MTVQRKGFLLRLDPALVERVDRERGKTSRNRWMEALIERELERVDGDHARGRLEEPETPPAEPATTDIAEVGEPKPLALDSKEAMDILTPEEVEELSGDSGHPDEDDEMEEWWR